ncbi:hypothetical protein ACJ8BV_02000 [Klebsiella pneumoniae]
MLPKRICWFTFDDAQPRAALGKPPAWLAELKSAEASLRQRRSVWPLAMSGLSTITPSAATNVDTVMDGARRRRCCRTAGQSSRPRPIRLCASYTQIAALLTGRVCHSAFHVGTLADQPSAFQAAGWSHFAVGSGVRPLLALRRSRSRRRQNRQQGRRASSASAGVAGAD